MANYRFRYGLTSCLVLLAFFSILLPWLISQRSLRLRDGKAMNTLQQLSSGYGYYAGLDENDSTWIDKCLEICHHPLIQTDGLHFYISDRLCDGNVYFFPFLDSYCLCEILFHFLNWRYAGMR